MAASTIIVQHRDGSPAKHARVALGFPAGNTNDVYTDSYGQAVVEHSSVGRATVYVSGQNRGTFHAPGRYAVTI
jgi:hypothetical protein